MSHVFLYIGGGIMLVIAGFAFYVSKKGEPKGWALPADLAKKSWPLPALLGLLLIGLAIFAP